KLRSPFCRRHLKPRQPHVPVGLNFDRTEVLYSSTTATTARLPLVNHSDRQLPRFGKSMGGDTDAVLSADGLRCLSQADLEQGFVGPWLGWGAVFRGLQGTGIPYLIAYPVTTSTSILLNDEGMPSLPTTLLMTTARWDLNVLRTTAIRRRR
ncbi:hypothetical protein BDZ89DRAFT_1055334, partial [Hymenopellis radicata]